MSQTLINLLCVGAGSCLGGMARYGVALAMRQLESAGRWVTLPALPTFVVNVAGCFAIGVVLALCSRHGRGAEALRMFLSVGFCGGFTTFSSFANENLLMMRGGDFAAAALYVMASLAGGLAAVYAGYAAGR